MMDILKFYCIAENFIARQFITLISDHLASFNRHSIDPTYKSTKISSTQQPITLQQMPHPYQQYYQQILTDPSVPNLLQSQFEDYGHPNYHTSKQIFPLCNQKNTPEFFKSNLLSPNRIIKYLSGDYCVYRAFYFQLFKLMFQIENDDKDYLEIFKQIVFYPDIIQRNGENSRAKREHSRVKRKNSRVKTNSNQLSHSDSRLSQLTQRQAFKRQFQSHQKCIAQFTQKVLQNKLNFTSFQPYLPYYPQIDQSMTLILQTFIQNQNSQQQMDSIQSILQYLCEIFEIQLVVIENCFKFQESDVFLYIEQKEDEEVWVYIAFNQITEDEDEGEEEEEEEEEEEDEDEGQEERRQDSQLYQNGQMESHDIHQQKNSTNYNAENHGQPFNHVQSPCQIPYPQQSQNSYTSSSNQNPSIRDKDSSSHRDKQSSNYRDKQSSSYRDNVITSEMKAQQQSQNQFNHYSPNHKFIPTSNKSPQEFNPQQLGREDNRPNRISSDVGLSKHQNSYERQNPLTKSYTLPRNDQNLHSNKSIVAHLPNYRSTNFHSNQPQSPFETISQSNGFVEHTKKQTRNFQKKVRYFDEDSIIEDNPAHKELTKMQSLTQAYREDAFHKLPDRDQGSFMGKSNHEVKEKLSQSSFQMIENSQHRINTERKVTDSKAETIINMFGDMLGSIANLNTLDPIQGSNHSISQGFGGISHHKMQAQQDTMHNPYNKPTQKKHLYAYGTLNNIEGNGQGAIDTNNLSMKKTKSEQQIIFEARPKDSVDVFSKVEIQETIVRDEYGAKSSLKSQAERRYRVDDRVEDVKLLLDSEELRTGNGNGRGMSNDEHYPFRNMGVDPFRNMGVERSSPQNSDRQYLQNMEAKSYLGQEQRSNRNKSQPGSFHNSSRGSSKSQAHQQQVQPPNIKVNSIKSQSETSSKEINQRNNYYREEDFAEFNTRNLQTGVGEGNLQTGFSVGCGFVAGNVQSGFNVEREPSIRSEEHSQREDGRNGMEVQGYRSSNTRFNHEYRSQQYVNVPAQSQTSHHNQNPQNSRAYTSHNQSSRPPKTLQTQNTQQDDFFFHPGNANKSSIKFGLITIEEVRASKETNRDSYRLGNGSKISNGHDAVLEIAEDRLQKYELVSSVTALGQEMVGRQEAMHSKASSAVNRLLEANSYKFKEQKQQSKELNDESVNNGTFYKQFTNSKVLKLLKEPYKTKVQILKSRFKGEHRTSINRAII